MIRQIIVFVGDLPQNYVTGIHTYNRIYQRLEDKHRVKYQPLKGWLGSDSKRVLYLSLTRPAEELRAKCGNYMSHTLISCSNLMLRK